MNGSISSKLLKELERKENRSKRNIANNAILKEDETLLLEAHSEEQEILEALGLDHELQESKVLKNEQTRTRLIEEKYNKSSYSGAQIKSLCNKYDLRLLPTKRYGGTIPPELATAIKDFCAEQDLTIRQNSFFILAPTELFKGQKHKAYADPILFYLEGSAESSSSHRDYVKEEDKLITVHNWGNDFSLTRKYKWLLSTYKYRESDTNNALRTLYMSLLILIGIIFQLLSGFEIPFLAVSLPILAVLAVFLGLSVDYKLDYINNNWNKNYRY